MPDRPDDPATRSGGRRRAGAGRRLGAWSTAVGIAVAVLAGFFVVRAIASEWSSVRRAIDDAEVGWLVAGVVVAGFAMLAIALPWRRCLAVVGARVPWGAAIAWYFVGEIGKYLPGGIWPVVGRGELARKGGHPRPATYASVALSLALLYLAAMAVTAVLVPFRFLDGDNDALWVLVLLPFGIAALHHRPLEWLVGRVERLTKRELPMVVPRWQESLRLIVEYVPAWILVGTATWCIARAFDPDVDWIAIAPAAILSWVVGFVLVPVPGGVGVREAALVALIGTSMSSGVRGAIAVAARLAFIVVDAGAALACSMVLHRWRAPVPGSEVGAELGAEVVGEDPATGS